MKQRIAILLITVLMSCMLPALGEVTPAPLRIVNAPWSIAERYQEQYPEQIVKNTALAYDEDLDNWLAQGCPLQEYLLRFPDEWDVAYIDTNTCDISVLYSAELLMDLQGEARLTDYFARLYPTVRNAVLVDAGIYGVPVELWGSVMQMGLADDRVLGQLGFSQSDAPQTFDDLCTLAEKYAELPKEQRKGTVFHIDGAQGNYQTYFLYCFLELYTAQYTNSHGYIRYDTPIFRQGLERVVGMAQALQKDPKIRYEQGGTLNGLTMDCGSDLIDGYYKHLYLRIGDNHSIPARLGMLVVNQNAKDMPAVLDFADLLVRHNEAEYAVYLGETDYDSILKLVYDRAIEAQKEQNEAQEVIDELEKAKAAGDTSHFYTQEAISAYAQNIVPHLTFPLMPRLDSYSLAKQFAKGRLDVDTLVEKLQCIADECAVERGNVGSNQ